MQIIRVCMDKDADPQRKKRGIQKQEADDPGWLGSQARSTMQEGARQDQRNSNRRNTRKRGGWVESHAQKLSHSRSDHPPHIIGRTRSWDWGKVEEGRSSESNGAGESLEDEKMWQS